MRRRDFHRFLALAFPASACSSFGGQNRPFKNGAPDLSKIFGKIQLVDSFPDFKVQVVKSFADLHVKCVDSFPDAPGKWKVVQSFPDYKIQIAESFPDFTIKYVESFPGVRL